MREILDLRRYGSVLTVLPDNDTEFPYYNPSIAYDGAGKLRIAIRSCNFTVRPQGGWYLADGRLDYAKTFVLYGYIDPDTYEITGLKCPIYSHDTPPETKDVSGLEDARIFWRPDGMHFIGVRVDTRDKHIKPASISEFVYEPDNNILRYMRTLEKPNPNRVEKNWGALNVPGDFEFNYSPTGTWTDGKVTDASYNGVLHGGSQLVWQPDTETWLAVLHDRKQTMVRAVGPRLRYISYFAEYDKAGTLKRLSNPFIFGSGYSIEFAAGMVEHGNDLLISVGLQDAMLGMVRIPKANALALLDKYRQDLEFTEIPVGSSVGWRSLETIRKAAAQLPAYEN